MSGFPVSPFRFDARQFDALQDPIDDTPEATPAPTPAPTPESLSFTYEPNTSEGSAPKKRKQLALVNTLGQAALNSTATGGRLNKLGAKKKYPELSSLDTWAKRTKRLMEQDAHIKKLTWELEEMTADRDRWKGRAEALKI